MGTNGTKNPSKQGEQAPLLGSEITTTKVNRRSFLARAMGAGTLAVGAAVTAACPDHDFCDTDFGDFGEGMDVGSNADTDVCDRDF